MYISKHMSDQFSHLNTLLNNIQNISPLEGPPSLLLWRLWVAYNASDINNYNWGLQQSGKHSANCSTNWHWQTISGLTINRRYHVRYMYTEHSIERTGVIIINQGRMQELYELLLSIVCILTFDLSPVNVLCNFQCFFKSLYHETNSPDL